MSWVGDALNAIQLKPRFLFGIALAAVLVLILPADAMGLAWLVPLRGWVSLIAIVAFCFWIVQLLPLYMQKRGQGKKKAAILASLDSLSPEEFMLLAYCLHRNKKTLLLKLTSTEGNVAAGLRQKGLMAIFPGTHNVLAWPHMIPEFVWQELQLRHDELLAMDGDVSGRLAEYFDFLDETTSGRPRWG